MREESQRYNHYNHAVGLAVVYLIFWPKSKERGLGGRSQEEVV